MLLKYIVLLVICGSSFSVSCAQLSLSRDENNGLEQYLLTFRHQNLTQHGLFVVGDHRGKRATDILVMAHGFHPNPPMYGRLDSGEESRPGDYYRKWVSAFARAGFNVFVPDYRGHNDSEGYQYTHQAKQVDFPEYYYATDLIVGTKELEQVLNLKFENIALIGHSMGGPIAFYAATKLGDRVKFVSIWSSAKYQFDSPLVSAPFVIHHGERDSVTPLENIKHYMNRHKNMMISKYLYPSDSHLLEGEDFNLAVERDVMHIRQTFNGKNL